MLQRTAGGIVIAVSNVCYLAEVDDKILTIHRMEAMFTEVTQVAAFIAARVFLISVL